ncbi:hypothetical protein ACPV5O_21330 [Vibrio maritimus]|uniref:hypothetical protein n=1 Tax=Vibrio maritimus TaxID=990268 RepID=UPI0040687BED
MEVGLDLSNLGFDCEFDLVASDEWRKVIEYLQNSIEIQNVALVLTFGPIIINGRKFHRFGQFVHRSLKMSSQVQIVEAIGTNLNGDLFVQQLLLRSRSVLVVTQPRENACCLEYLCT